MRKLFDLFKGLFDTPSDFAGDAEGWTNNQSAHAMFIGTGLMLMITTLAFSGLYTPLSAGSLFLVMALYAVWEVLQIANGSKWLDSITDWAFVSSGAVLAWAGMLGDRESFTICLVGIVFALALGALKRL